MLITYMLGQMQLVSLVEHTAVASRPGSFDVLLLRNFLSDPSRQ